jgi:hypothetical protein
LSEAFDDLMEQGEPIQASKPTGFVRGNNAGNKRHYRKMELDFTLVRPIQTNGQCKICQHPERSEIDKMIYRQRMKDVTDDGEPFTLDYLIGYLVEIGVPSPNKVNVQSHWRKHVEIPSVALVGAENKALTQILEKLTSDQILTMPRTELLDLMMRQGVLEAGARLLATGKSGISVADVLKIAELQIREKGSEAQNEFLKALGGGIVAAVRNGVPAKQLANAEVIVDADVVEEEAVDVAA